MAFSSSDIKSKEKFFHPVDRIYFLGGYAGSDYFTTPLRNDSMLYKSKTFKKNFLWEFYK